MKLEAKQTPWQARWIWGGDEESPRNEWRMFRHTFEWPADLPADAVSKLWLTADSRYEVYVNGKRVGRGPARYFPSHIFYDCYPVGHLLHHGERNTIAVLVMHYGIDNFYYLRGRGGLLAELTAEHEGGVCTLAATGPAWSTSLQTGHAREIARMSCQHAFAERIDARLMDENWMERDYDDTAWDRAAVIGEAGMEPWTELQPRDIPYLTEEAVSPVSVLSLNRVIPYRLTSFLDNYTLMKPQGEGSANPLCYAGAFATVVKLEEPAELDIMLHVSGFGVGEEVPGLLTVGGKALKPRHEPPLLYFRTELPAGEHLLLYTAFGPDHGHMQRIGIDSDKPVAWINPFAPADGSEEVSPFAAIGPLYSFHIVDFEVQTERFAAWREAAARLASEAAKVGNVQQLAELGARLGLNAKPIPALLCNGNDAFMPQYAKRVSESYTVPASLQRTAVTSSDPGEVPVFGEGDTEFTLDFGKEWSGFLQFEIESDEGVVIDWYGVEYVKDGYVQHTFGLDHTLRYVARSGCQRYTSPIRRGFRYMIVTVRGAKKPVRLHGVRLLQSNYPAPEIGAFQSSDAGLNAIWEMARHTTRLCMEDTFVDCPAYEQTFWVGDSRNAALINYYLFGGTDIVKRCLRLVPHSAYQTPLYVDQVPSGWTSVIPNWTFFWAAACAEYAEHTGDRAFAAEMLPKVIFTLRHYEQRINGDGLLEIKGWNLLDWAPMDQPGDGIVTHQNLMLAHTLRRTRALAALAGKEDSAEAVWCGELSVRLDQAINHHLWSRERNAYLDCIHKDGRRSDIFSMQTQVMALLSGTAQGERKEQLAGYLKNAPEGFVPIGSPFMSFFYYEALAQQGAPEDMKLLLDDIRRNYGFMIDNGATTCWEMYGHTTMNRANANDLTRSHCHAWSAAPGYFLGAFALGVRSAAPGWTKVLIEPRPGDLAWARGSVPLPHGGKADIAWTADAGALTTLEITAPDDLELDIRVPDGCAVSVKRVRAFA